MNLDDLAKLIPSASWRLPEDDGDPQETQEWLDALDAVIAAGSLEAAYAGFFKAGSVQIPPLFLDLVVQALVCNLLDGVDAQHLYNAARNVETAAWLLAQRRNAQGQPLLLADEIGAQGRNLSFEREFGKIIARLDLLAAFTTEKYRRAAISYVQGIVGGTFLQFLPVR